jgi:hypothetical protein
MIDHPHQELHRRNELAGNSDVDHIAFTARPMGKNILA